MLARSQLIAPVPQMIVTEMLDAVTGGGGTGGLVVVGYTTMGPSAVRINGDDAGGTPYQRNSSAYLAATTGRVSLVYDITMPTVLDCTLFCGWIGAAGNASIRIHNPGAGWVFSHYVDAVDHDFAVVLPVVSQPFRVYHEIVPGSGSRMRIEDLAAGTREGGNIFRALLADTYQFTLGISSGAAAANRVSDFHLRHVTSDI